MPDVFYDMEIQDFLLMSKGFWKRQEYEESKFKRLAVITHSSMVGKPLHPDKLWPIGESKKVDKDFLKKRSESVMKQLEMMERIEQEMKKNGAVKNSN